MSEQPSAAWDWTKVQWREPGAGRATHCCYCEAPIGKEDLRLLLVGNGGVGAEFCAACDETYWSDSACITKP